MMNAYAVLMAFTKWMWSLPVLLILIGGGLCLTAACDFVQIRHFGYMIKKTYRCAVKKEQGKISGVQAMLATLACTIGTGNIVGVGSAIALGGPGAIFWMWGIGFVAMALKYSEAVLGVATRIKDENGHRRAVYGPLRPSGRRQGAVPSTHLRPAAHVPDRERAYHEKAEGRSPER